MKIKQRVVEVYGWVSLGILVVLLVLVWTDSIGAELRLPLLMFAFLLIVSRLVLRLLSHRRNRENAPGNDPEEDR